MSWVKVSGPRANSWDRPSGAYWKRLRGVPYKKELGRSGVIHGKSKFACPVPNKCSFREQVFGNIHNMYAYKCTRTYVRVHI